MNDPFIRLYSGKTFHFLHPTLEEIDITDIAHSLSRIVRYYGHCHGDYVVANHLCLCADVAPEGYELLALAHDFQEFVLGDVSSPLKSLLPQYQELETHVTQLIARKFNLPYPYPAIVNEIDKRMLVTEFRDLLKDADWTSFPWKPYDFKIEPWSMDRAEQEFLKRFHRYYEGQT